MQKTDAEIYNCIKTQDELIKSKGHPYFPPTNGMCFRCHKNIYQNYDLGYRVSHGYNGTELVTGCPHCNYSFCD